MLRGGVLAVGAEVTQTHELVGGRSLGVLQGSLDFTAGEDFQRVGIQAAEVILARCIGIGIVKQVGVLTDLGIHSSGGVHPVDGSALDLAAIGGVAAPGLRIVGGQDFGDIAVLIGDTAGALDQISTLQTALGAIGVQTLVLGDGLSQEGIGLDHRFREKVISRVPSSGRLGLFSTTMVSVWPSG